MTPQEMIQKFKDTRSTEFLGDLSSEDFWEFISRDILWILDPLGYDNWIEEYDMLQPEVVKHLRRRYEGMEDE